MVDLLVLLAYFFPLELALYLLGYPFKICVIIATTVKAYLPFSNCSSQIFLSH